jgi:divalent metal cation (Fe/Co/Zn/Cd) transporter
VVGFYRRQNDIIDSMLVMDAVHAGEADFDTTEEEALARRILNYSLISNVILLAVRVAIAVIAGSLSLIIATIDAVLDVVSSLMMYYCAWEARRVDQHRYPVGKHRMEPLGVVVFSVVMATAAVNVVIEAGESLRTPGAARM